MVVGVTPMSLAVLGSPATVPVVVVPLVPVVPEVAVPPVPLPPVVPVVDVLVVEVPLLVPPVPVVVPPVLPPTAVAVPGNALSGTRVVAAVVDALGRGREHDVHLVDVAEARLTPFHGQRVPADRDVDVVEVGTRHPGVGR
jgi:hypothetical protein